jgi:hypothetical protein
LEWLASACLALVVGWSKVQEWNLKNVMMIYTVSLIALLVGYAMIFAGGFSLFTQLLKRP